MGISIKFSDLMNLKPLKTGVLELFGLFKFDIYLFFMK